MTFSPSNLKFNVILKCLRGIEHNLFNELQSFGIERNSLIRSKCKIKVLDCNLREAYFLSYFSRLASNVYFEVGKIRLSDKKTIFKGCEGIEWNDFISPSNSYLINCSSLEANEYINSRRYACQLVKDVIKDHFVRNLNLDAPKVELKNPEIKFELDVNQDCMATVMVDATGTPLSSRAYRNKPNISDIDPTMACSILYDMGYSSFSETPFTIREYEGHWKRVAFEDKLGVSLSKDSTNSNDVTDLIRTSIVDLFSGCGVFLIESALWAARIPPGYLKSKYSFQKMPIHDEIAYKTLRTYTDTKKINPGSEKWKRLSGTFIGIERDWEKLESSLRSSEKAGVLGLMSFNQANYLKDGISDAINTCGSGKWEYMIAQLPQMRERSIGNSDDRNTNDGIDSCFKEEESEFESEREIGSKRIRKNKLSATRYLTLVKSLSRLKKRYFQEGSKGALMLPSFIDKVYVEDFFNGKLSVGKTYNKNGINNTTYYTVS